jgi:HEPN domain-containing protein
MKAETERWVQLSDEDVQMAEAAWERALYSPCLFHCQQMVEKVLKAGLAEAGIEVPKTHDLVGLANRLKLDLDTEQKDFLGRLTEQYIPTRYGDVWVEYPRDVAENYFETAKGMYIWLLQQLK